VFTILCIIWKVIGKLPRKRVIDISKEIKNKFKKDGYPEDEAKEGNPDSTSASIAKVIIIVDMMFAIDGDNLV
jgi:hypothetical protein